MKKIYIDKNDTVAAVIEKVINIPDDDIILYIPRFTKLVGTANNFRLLKREIDSSGKNVQIESVDDEVLEMAKSVGIPAKNPFFQKNRKAFSDIVAVNERPASGPATTHSRQLDGITNLQEEDKEIEFVEEETVEKDNRHKEPLRTKISRITKRIRFRVDNGEGEEPIAVEGGSRRLAWTVLAVLGTVTVLLFFMLQSAKIVVNMEKTPWSFNGNLRVSAAVKNPYYSSGQIYVAGAIFDQNKNITNSFPASGSQTVSRKASGKITVYNAYSSSPQPIVKDTRFSTPDGKIYRIDRGVTIPGAKIVNNKIVPSSIVLTVYADKPGAEYNIGPTTFRIPGFQGTAKYEGFYAESSGSMTGGAVGTIKVATEADIQKAKDQNRKVLQTALSTELSLRIPSDIKIINGASSFTIIKEDVASEADEAGNFQVSTQGNLKIFGFKESDLLTALQERFMEESEAQLNGGSAKDLFVLKSGTPSYGQPQINASKQELTAMLKFDSVWARAFDLESFRKMVLGKSEGQLKEEVKGIAGVESVEVSLWPFWVSRVPNSRDKVSIDVR